MNTKKLLMSATMLFALGCYAQTSGAGSSTPDQGSAGSSSTTPQSSTSSGSMSSGSQTSPSSASQGSYGSSQSSSTDTSSGSNTGKKQKGEKTIKGCIAGTSGSYTLQEKGGKKSVNLESSQDLSAHVGHEVKLHGHWENSASTASASPSSSDTTSGSMASNTGSSTASSTGTAGTSSNARNKDQNKTFVVDSVDMVSDQCKSGNASSASNSQTGTSPR